MGEPDEIPVAVERHPAYRVLTARPGPDHPGVVVSLAQLRLSPEQHLGPLRCADGIRPEQAYGQILDLVQRTPGLPLGLTFDGGLAVTVTDYRLAEQRWERQSGEG